MSAEELAEVGIPYLGYTGTLEFPLTGLFGDSSIHSKPQGFPQAPGGLYCILRGCEALEEGSTRVAKRGQPPSPRAVPALKSCSSLRCYALSTAAF